MVTLHPAPQPGELLTLRGGQLAVLASTGIELRLVYPVQRRLGQVEVARHLPDRPPALDPSADTQIRGQDHASRGKCYVHTAVSHASNTNPTLSVSANERPRIHGWSALKPRSSPRVASLSAAE